MFVSKEVADKLPGPASQYRASLFGVLKVAALFPQDVADELRYRAGRLRQEMDLPDDASSSDGKGFPVCLVLAIAMLDAARAEWEALAERWPEIRDIAKELARKEHSDIDVIVGAVPGQPPVLASVPRIFRREGDSRLAPVLGITHNLAGMRPIWAHYLEEAREAYDAKQR